MERANSLQRAHSGLARVPRAGAGGRTSDVLKRLGGALSVEGPGSPLTATVSLPLTSLETEPSEEVEKEEPCGLTPASLKHLKRQRDALQEDKARLQSELIETAKQLKELRPQVASLKQQLEEALSEHLRLQEALEASEQRASLAERRTEELTEELAHAVAEVERLKAALEEQRKLTQEVCEASGRKNEAMEKQKEKEMEELQQLVERLKLENQQQRCDLQAQQEKHAEMKRNVVVAMAAAEKAMQMHQQHSAQLEMLRSAKLAEAINQKVELHIAVPKVTLTYNNAPPLLISVAAALGEDRLQKFLDQEVFPHFEPLWVRLDGLDHAPDGSSKKAYSSRMLDRLTSAVKSFLARSQGETEGSPSSGQVGGQHGA